MCAITPKPLPLKAGVASLLKDLTKPVKWETHTLESVLQASLTEAQFNEVWAAIKEDFIDDLATYKIKTSTKRSLIFKKKSSTYFEIKTTPNFAFNVSRGTGLDLTLCIANALLPEDERVVTPYTAEHKESVYPKQMDLLRGLIKRMYDHIGMRSELHDEDDALALEKVKEQRAVAKVAARFTEDFI